MRNDTRYILASRESIWGGGEVFLENLAEELERRGRTVTYRVPSSSALGRRTPRRLTGSRPWARGTRVVANDFRSLWISALREPFRKRLFIVHGRWQLSRIRAIFSNIFAEAVVCVNSSLAESARGLGAKRVAVVPLGPAAVSVAPIWQKIPDRPNVGNVARLDPVKRLELFSEALSDLEADGVLVCPQPRTQAERRLLTDLKENNRLQVYSDGNPEIVWSTADLFLSTSADESFGLALLEALQRGIPAFTTAKEGPREFLKGPLAIGLLDVSSEPIDDAVRQAIRLYNENIVSYGKAAREVLDARGPVACCELIEDLLS